MRRKIVANPRPPFFPNPEQTALSERVAAEARARAAELRLHNPGWGRSILDDAAHEADQLEVLARELDDERARAFALALALARALALGRAAPAGARVRGHYKIVRQRRAAAQYRPAPCCGGLGTSTVACLR